MQIRKKIEIFFSKNKKFLKNRYANSKKNFKNEKNRNLKKFEIFFFKKSVKKSFQKSSPGGAAVSLRPYTPVQSACSIFLTV
jgi:hypothetical protein